jgi:hypothetical protein
MGPDLFPGNLSDLTVLSYQVILGTLESNELPEMATCRIYYYFTFDLPEMPVQSNPSPDPSPVRQNRLDGYSVVCAKYLALRWNSPKPSRRLHCMPSVNRLDGTL